MRSLHEGLAALYAYESQIPAVAKAKIDGLAAWYGITEPRDVAFFSVHMTADVEHAGTARMLLEQFCDTPEKCEEGACVGSADARSAVRVPRRGDRELTVRTARRGLVPRLMRISHPRFLNNSIERMLSARNLSSA